MKKTTTTLIALLCLMQPAMAQPESKWIVLFQQETKRAGFGNWKVVYAYCKNESNLDPRQDYSAGGLRALGMCSVQRQDHPQYSVGQLKDVRFNIYLTAKEFRDRWTEDPITTSAVVFYPRWAKWNGPAGGWSGRDQYMGAIRRLMRI